MNGSDRRVVRLIVGLAAAASLYVVPQLLSDHPGAALAQPCVNGVIPLNPYVVNCNLPPRQNRVRGAAPDAGAIIACRHNPWCLSYYVNGP
jgi:hypothetical protein